MDPRAKTNQESGANQQIIKDKNEIDSQRGLAESGEGD